MVKIYLRTEDNFRDVLALSIPLPDIRRLSVRPLKWLQFVTFAVCGAHGHLSLTSGGPAVDYDSISLVDPLAEAYYYTREENSKYFLTDCNVLDGTITSTRQTPRRHDFRDDVVDRDGACVFTRTDKLHCQAVHIIPRSKGNEYIDVVVQDRLGLYPADVGLEIDGIDDVQNGILLTKDLHSFFGEGEIAFLKTPNFALDPADIPYIEGGPMPPSRITLQRLKPSSGICSVPDFDVHMTGTNIAPPPSILLDYMYGAAVYQLWGLDGPDMIDMMNCRHTYRYQNIPVELPSADSSQTENSQERDNDNDSDYDPSPQNRNHRSHASDGLLRAMDGMARLAMLIKGKTSEEMVVERQKRADEAELRRRERQTEASRMKVEHWKQESL